MKDIDDADLKNEINEIMKNVDDIMKKIETLDPAKKDQADDTQNEN